jgi:thioredoxin reductase (NADPH)
MTESTIIWTIFGVLASVIFIGYAVKFKRAQYRGLKLKKESAELGANRPIAQYPQIDDYKCIGCGACIQACPEGGVLGLAMGKAVLINGLKCVGHGLCAEACPVEGITIGLGNLKERDDIPLLSENNETSIKGIYIAGELSGLALIKNAIQQGVRTIDAMKAELQDRHDPNIPDVAIIGAGPAGMSAALRAIEHKLSYVLIDQQTAGGTILQYPRKKVVMTQPVDIPLYGRLNKKEYSKEELLEIWTATEEKFGVEVKTGQKLRNIVRTNGDFEVQTDKGSYKSHRVILALGRRGTPRKLGVPGENQAKVMYKLIDADSHRHENILVVGGGDSAIEAAMGLARQQGNKVTISYRKQKFFRLKTRNEERIRPYLKDGRIKVIFESELLEINEKNILLKTPQGEETLNNDYVFIFAGGEPPFQLLQQIGIVFGSSKSDVT